MKFLLQKLVVLGEYRERFSSTFYQEEYAYDGEHNKIKFIMDYFFSFKNLSCSNKKDKSRRIFIFAFWFQVQHNWTYICIILFKTV